MTEARFTLTIPALSHDAANDLATALEEDIRVDPLAITINETDEARALWELVLYFGSEEEADAAREVEALARPHRPDATAGLGAPVAGGAGPGRRRALLPPRRA